METFLIKRHANKILVFFSNTWKKERQKERKKEGRKEKGTRVAIQIEKGWKTISDVVKFSFSKENSSSCELDTKKVSYFKIENMFFPVREF